jgi:formylmethanofuran dehydrogenase subunit E
MAGLPQPDYEPAASDPDWLAAAVQFHGHLGPWAVAGLRMGMAGRRAVEAEGYFDVAVTCHGPLVRPPKSCFLDGLQVSTGATLGKRNLRWIEADRLAVEVENTRTGQKVIVRPTPRLMEMLGPLEPKQAGQSSDAAGPGPAEQDHAALERLARSIATAADREILIVVSSEKGGGLPAENGQP